MAINGTQELIQAITVASGGSANIEFTNIPATYDDLKIVISGRIVSGNDGTLSLSFNGSTSNFSYKRLIGDGSNASSYGDVTNSWGFLNRSDTTSNMFGNTEIYISNYRSSNNKSISIDSAAENGATTAFLGIWAGLWSNSASITSVRINGASNISEHSTAILYGITRVPFGAKATGGVITEDSTYWYHTFTSSGIFTPTQSITAECLVVAGGGGAGQNISGGGGAGGLQYLSTAISPSSYSVTIGAGGAGFAASNTATQLGNNGNNSSINTILTSTGGGAGNGYAGANVNGNNGGSGGGGSCSVDLTAGGNGGTASSGQGFNGGIGASFSGGGGGGKGSIGSNASNDYRVGGAGGAGTNTYSAWASATGTGHNGFYASGGGGGTWDGTAGTTSSGGGGAGGKLLIGASDGLSNTGGGGGGGPFDNSAGNYYAKSGSGGSGIVIIRYPK
jgi:hypothetical protein